MKRHLLFWGLILGMAACSDTGFQGSSKTSGKKDDDATGKTDTNGGDDNIDLDDDLSANGDKDPKDGDGFEKIDNEDGNADTVLEDSEAGVRKETFGYGGSSAQELVDYLFIMDNSCSMGGIIDKTAAGFEALIAKGDDVFPDKSKVAVMNTMPADPNNLANTFVNGLYAGANQEPGFMALVSDERIENYKNAAPNKAKKWPLAGCDEWFDPGAKNGNGDSCLKAHTQQTYHCTGAEAGATALMQFMEKQGDDRTFRRGAIVNIIFVSDTHDPGNGNATLANIRPSADALTDAIKENNSVAGVKYHAIAPESKCTGEELHGRYYFDLVNATDGVQADPCKNKDYSGPIQSIVDVSDEIENPVFVLSKKVKKVYKVLVDGKETEDYDLSDDGYTVTLKAVKASEEVEVEIIYEYK